MKFKEISSSTLHFPLRENFCCEWSEDDKMFIVNADRIEVHQLRPRPSSTHKWGHMHSSTIFPVATNPTTNSGFQQECIPNLRRYDLFRALSDPLVTPHFDFSSTPPSVFKKAFWSPGELLTSNDCLIAALTTLGSVTIWNHISNWSAILDVSHLIYLHLKQNKCLLKHFSNLSDSLDNVRINSMQLATSAACWSDTVYRENEERYLYFTAAQKNGTIYIWKLTPKESDDTTKLNANLLTEYASGFDDISELKWITYSNSVVYLLLGTTKGLVKCIQLKRLKTTLKFTKISSIWDDEDDIAVSKIASIKWNEKTFLGIMTKGTYIITFLLNENSMMTNMEYKNLGNLCITGLQMLNNREMVVSTLKGIIFSVKIIKDESNVPRLNMSVIESDVNCNQYAVHGLCASKNNALWFMLLNPCKRVKRYHGKNWSICVLLYNEYINPFNLLLGNQTELLTNYWDCLELIRILNAKNVLDKNHVDMDEIKIENCQTLYRIKLCFWLNIILNDAFEAQLITKDVNKLILSYHATNYLNKLAKKYKKTSKLSESELETVSLQFKLIDPTLNIENMDVILSIKDLPQITKYCEWCDEELVYPICSQYHPREFCCVTFRDVNSLKNLVCSLCNAVGHIDLRDKDPLCTFCDSRLKFSLLCTDKIDENVWKMDVADDNIKEET